MDDAEGLFRGVFESTYSALARYARHRGLSGTDADDLVAGTYEVAWLRTGKRSVVRGRSGYRLSTREG